MRYTVTASTELQERLAQIWMEAPDRNAVTLASNTIDRILRTAPLTWGEIRGDERVLTIGPLTVVYTVSPDDCQVTIKRYEYTG